jgi:hypothetical protein
MTQRGSQSAPWDTFRLATLPMILPGVVAGALLALPAAGPWCSYGAPKQPAWRIGTAAK